ncbi:MFS transporter [Nonomuraea jiangxiensis]|uniref:MFS transporter, DHA2 family, methylenomycin A resistance protein n=1 Tax=Nonomuraea jiangxiensis TaxID=633440 RepID=A0A1G9UU36_9ACTN|nr:MFS transporter [Nonomuraea jiangxiensis]SDM63307.1 MFS transporter, DHA2 family, methylenomycin A resistance protein [Nonomuraea jiangxiensis]
MRQGFVLVAASLGFAVIQLDVSVVNVAIKPIGAELGGGVTALQWVVDAYTVALAALILVAGTLGDFYGAKRLFIAGFAVFVAASAGCGLAANMAELIAARAVQGIGAAALAACSLSLLHHAYTEPEPRARAVGLWAAGASTALVAGPVVGGLVIATLGWRSIFFVNVPIGAIGIWLTLSYATGSPRSRDQGLDLCGQVSAVAALTALAVATIEAGSRGMDDPVVLAGFAVALAAGAGFVVAEVRGAEPMLSLSLFRSARFGVPVAIGLLVNVAFYGLIFVLSLYFQKEQHASALWTGLAFAPMMAAIMAANLTANRLTGALGARRVLLIGTSLLAAGCLAMLGTTARTPYAALVVPLMAEGFGLGLIVPVMASVLLSGVDRSRSGRASGTLNAARQTGSVLGVALFGSLAAATGPVNGLHTALLISTGLIVAVATLGTGIPTVL